MSFWHQVEVKVNTEDGGDERKGRFSIVPPRAFNKLFGLPHFFQHAWASHGKDVSHEIEARSVVML